MKKIFFIFITLVSTTFFSCENYLDIKPKGYIIPQYYDDYVKLLNSMPLARVISLYPLYLTDDLRAGDASDVTKGANWTSIPQYKKNLYTFANGPVFSPGETDVMYEPIYYNIYTYNVIINNIMDVPDGTEVDKKRVKAEALIGRAFNYLVLINVYAEHYDPATAATAPGVPLVLTEDINSKYIRNTVAEVYAQIKKDLDEALPDLATVVPNNFHPLKSVGFAFLSKMYLYMGNYQEALKNANQALKLNNYLIDYKLYTTKTGTTFGRVCLQTDNMIPFPDANKNQESIWVKLGSSSSGTFNAEVYASDDLMNVFKQDLPTGAIDKRRTLFYLDGSSLFGTKPVTFKGRVLYAGYLESNNGLSSPDLYLIAAECEARIGDKETALQHLNTLRNSRIQNNQPLVATSNEEALTIVLKERRRELAFNGIERLIDLKRLNKDARFAKTITHVQGTDTYTLPANDKRYIMPIPPKVLDFNPNMPQYDR